MTNEELIERLLTVSGVLYVQPELLAEWSRDWSPYGAKIEIWEEDLPLCAISPDSVEDVAAVVRIANEAARPIMIRGGGSGLTGAIFPVPGSILLDLAGLNVIGEIDEVNGLVTVDAGVYGGELEAHLNSHGYSFALESRSQNLSSIGGMIATNAYGLLSTGFGDMASKVVALEMVLADGSISRVAESGVMSTLKDAEPGVITSATLRIAPSFALVPMSFVLPSFEDAIAAAHALCQAECPCLAVVFDEVGSLSTKDVQFGQCILIVGFPFDVHDSLAANAIPLAKRLESSFPETWWANRYSADWIVEENENDGWMASEFSFWIDRRLVPQFAEDLGLKIQRFTIHESAEVEVIRGDEVLLSLNFHIRCSSADEALDAYENVRAIAQQHVQGCPGARWATTWPHVSTGRFVQGQPVRRE